MTWIHSIACRLLKYIWRARHDETGHCYVVVALIDSRGRSQRESADAS
jgi:hypothetical protein